MGDAKKLGFVENFMLAGVAAGVSKTAAAPIERIKLLVQNQDEMIEQGRLDKPYKGVIDCTTRVLKTEGVYPCGEETWLMSSDTSPLRLLTLPSRILSRPSLPPPRPPVQAQSSQPTLPAVVLPVPCLCCLCTLLIMPELGWLTIPRAREVSASSMASLMCM